jgi:hypothetical protein
MVDEDEEDKIQNVSAALFLGGSDTVRSILDSRTSPRIHSSLTDRFGYDHTLLRDDNEPARSQEGTGRAGCSHWD